MKIGYFLAALFFLVPGLAYAEGVCPPGQYPVGDARAPGCAPIPGYENNSGNAIKAAPPRPTGEWIKTWGAVADNGNGDAGSSVGKLTREEAEQEAVKNCLSWGGGGCDRVFVYHNQCVAIAEGQKNNGEGFYGKAVSASSIEQASDVAIEYCVKAGATCKVSYTACTEPIFRRY